MRLPVCPRWNRCPIRSTSSTPSRDARTATNDMLSNSKLGMETMNQVMREPSSNPRQSVVFSDQGEADTFTGNKTNAVVTANPQVAKDMEYNLVWDQL